MKHLELFPSIEITQAELEKQNRFLNKVTLTGKINALDVAATLFEFTDKMVIVFDELNKELIEALVDTNMDKIVQELRFKSQTAIDILIRNLFERTADVGFLATDSVIISFLRHNNPTASQMQKRLQAYVSNYSVYNEIVIFDTFGNVAVNLNSKNKIQKSTDPIIKEALESSSYVEAYRESDILCDQHKSLLFAHKIVDHGTTIGVLVMSFKLEDELSMILSALATDTERLYLCDNDGVIFSNDNRTRDDFRYSDLPYSVTPKREIQVMSKTGGYQEYEGIKEWYCVAQTTVKEEKIEEYDHSFSLNILDENLQNIIERANELVEDISDVIINGELIAAKRRVYLLGPILENLRDISGALLTSIEDSVKNLEAATLFTLVNNAKKSAHLAIDIMDRNLYERANDCRWWALTPLFIEELSKASADQESLEKTLKHINDLYSVYTTIFIFDKNKKVVASSNESVAVGTKIDKEYIEKALKNRDPKNYFVSPFEATPFYDNKPTYIYVATILGKGGAIGGVGVVFDSEHEFHTMLKESFLDDQKGFMLFVQKDRTIIASSLDHQESLEQLAIDEKYFSSQNPHSKYDFIEYKEKQYMMAVAGSHGYREYKREDNYTNEIYAVSFLEI